MILFSINNFFRVVENLPSFFDKFFCKLGKFVNSFANEEKISLVDFEKSGGLFYLTRDEKITNFFTIKVLETFFRYIVYIAPPGVYYLRHFEIRKISR